MLLFFPPLGLPSRACRHKLQQAGSSKHLGRAGDPLPEETLGTRLSLVLANTQMHPPAFHGHGRVPSASVSPASSLLPGFPGLGGGDQGAEIQNTGKLCALSKKNPLQLQQGFVSFSLPLAVSPPSPALVSCLMPISKQGTFPMILPLFVTITKINKCVFFPVV